MPKLSFRIALDAKRVPGRKDVVESKGAPKSTIFASSYSQSQPIKVNTFLFIGKYLLYIIGQCKTALMQLGVVISHFQPELFPLLRFEVIYGVKIF